MVRGKNINQNYPYIPIILSISANNDATTTTVPSTTSGKIIISTYLLIGTRAIASTKCPGQKPVNQKPTKNDNFLLFCVVIFQSQECAVPDLGQMRPCAS